MDQRLENGTKLENFKIVRLIAKGGMGEVYEGFEELLNRKVALKIIAIDPSNHMVDDVVKLFITEGQTLAKMNHPNVVTIYRLGYDKETHFIAMEFVEGPSLQELLKKRKVSLGKALFIFKNILSGTRALHENGIIHRDLKPKNIIIEKNASVKIVDFGISENSDVAKENQSSVVMGSCYYMAPESLKGNIVLQSDIWSIGVMLYELLTGEKLFNGITQNEVLQKVSTMEIRFNRKARSIPKGIQQIILKMCERDLTKRYKNIKEIQQDLKNVINLPEEDFENTSSIALAEKNFTARNLKLLPDFEVPKKQKPMAPEFTQVHDFFDRAGAPTKTGGNTKSSEISAANNWKKVLGWGLGIIILGITGLNLVNKYLPALPEDQISTPKTPANQQVQIKKDPLISSPKKVSKSPGQSSTVTVTNPVRQSPQPSPIVKSRSAKSPKNPVSKIPKKPDSKPHKIKRSRAITRRVKINGHQRSITLNWKPAYRARGIASVQAGITNPPIFSWKRNSHAYKYLIQVSKNKRFSNLLVDKSTSSPSYQWKQASPGTFYWRVKGISKGKSRWKFSPTGRLKVFLPQPKLGQSFYNFTQKENWNPSSRKSSKSNTISWSKVPMAHSYQITISKNRSGTRPVISKTVTTNFLNLSLPYEGTFYSFVTALNLKRSPASKPSKPATINYRKIIKLLRPSLKIPLAGINVPTQGTMITPIAFKWGKVGGAKKYKLQFSRSKDFSNILYEESVSTTSYLFTKPIPSIRVYWRLQALGPNGAQSPWSEIRHFKID